MLHKYCELQLEDSGYLSSVWLNELPLRLNATSCTRPYWGISGVCSRPPSQCIAMAAPSVRGRLRPEAGLWLAAGEVFIRAT